MLVRVRSSTGTQRVEIGESAALRDLKNKIQELLSLESFTLCRDPAGNSPLTNDTATLSSLQLRHGDMVYVTGGVASAAPRAAAAAASASAADVPRAATPAVAAAAAAAAEVEELPIDKYMAGQDGWIQRPPDPRMCKHPQRGRCAACMPIAPWKLQEVEPWKSQKVQWMPVHAWLRMKQDTAGCRHPPGQRCLSCRLLEPPSYRVKVPCPSRHAPWPDGICGDCKPPSCTVDQQAYRHVDRLEFDAPQVLNDFLEAYRRSGQQRCGYLYGRVVPEPTLPLGIRAQIAAIHEPPQRGSNEGVALAVDATQQQQKARAEYLADALGLSLLGFVWTNIAVDAQKRPVAGERAEHPVLASELLVAAKSQAKNPAPSRATNTGTFGSKFVSVVVAGTADHTLEPVAFQASDQLTALVRDGVVASVPEDEGLLKARASSAKRYVPDIFYRETGSQGESLTRQASPTFPAAFGIVRLGVGTPKNPSPMFTTAFPVENRGSFDRQQTPGQALELLRSSGEAALRDFHLLLFLASSTQIGLPQATVDKLVGWVRAKVDSQAGNTAAVRQALAETIQRLTQISGGGSSSLSAPAPAAAGAGAASSAPGRTVSPMPRQPSPAPPPPAAAVEDPRVAQLEAMGFPRAAAQQAATATKGRDIAAALDWIDANS